MEPSFLKNKLAHLLVTLVRRQYPNEWPTFFHELLAMLGGNGESTAMIDLYLRICVSLDQEVVCRYIHRNADEMNVNTTIVRIYGGRGF